jgi:Lipocalin-like domain
VDKILGKGEPSSEPIDANHPIIGTWQLTRFVEENVATTAVTQPFGPRPKAQVIYTSDGYVSTLFTAANRRGPVNAQATDAEAVVLYRSMVAFAGRYALRGDMLIYYPGISPGDFPRGFPGMRPGTARCRSVGLSLTIIVWRSGRLPRSVP